VFGPEVGWFFTPELLVSVALRFQLVFGLTGEPVTNGHCGTDMYCSPSSGAFAGFAKATYFFGTEGTRFALGGEIGGGTIRHGVPFNEMNLCSSGPGDTKLTGCVDTLDGGPFLIGPTFGLYFQLGDAIDFMVAINSQLGLPNFTLNFDGQVGIVVRLVRL
jgi:hypothetical protein